MNRLVIFCLLLSGCARQASEVDIKGDLEENAPTLEQSLMLLPSFGNGENDYRCDPYIRAAVQLQGLGRWAAHDALEKLARKEQALHEHRVVILCRMLFKMKAGGEFRRPRLGGAVFLGDTDYSDWPLEPLEIVDGIPFLIVQGYILGGVAESSKGYLAYCVSNCEWNSVPYRAKTAAEKARALEKLLRSPKWKGSMDNLTFLEEQVK